MVNKFYQKHKEILKNRARKRYQNIFGKKKERKGERKLEKEINILLKKKKKKGVSSINGIII